MNYCFFLILLLTCTTQSRSSLILISPQLHIHKQHNIRIENSNVALHISPTHTMCLYENVERKKFFE